jgi:HEAT repeats
MSSQGDSSMPDQHLIDLASDVHDISETALEWFLQQGPMTTTILVEGLDDNRLGSVGHSRILHLLRYFSKDETVPAILKAARKYDPIVLSAAMQALAAIKTPECIDALCTFLQEDNPDIAKQAAILLGETGAASAVKPLLRLLDSNNTSVRFCVVSALIQLDGSSVYADLGQHLERETDLEIRDLIASKV